MKKNIVMTAGLLSTLSSVVISNESYAVNEIDSINENSRNITQLNKRGKVINVVSNDVLNVRVKPDASSELVFTLKNSEKINVLAQDNATGWYKVSYNGKEGYASNRYIEIIGDMTEVYTVTADINIRKEANWSAEIIDVAKKNSKLNVISIDGAWAKVSYNNTICYAPSDYLEKVGGETPSNPSKPNTPSTTEYTVTADINLRKEASWSGEIVSVAKKDSKLNVISIDGAWAKVSYNNTICYAPSDYLEKVGGETPSNPSKPNKPSTTEYIVTTDINLRKEASWSAEIIDVAKKDSKLNVISIDGAWAKVNYSNTICYAPSDYLEKVGGETPSNPSTPEITKSTIATVNTNDLNIRAGGGMSYSILAKVNKGDTVLILEDKDSNGWYKVQLTTGVVGWCYGDYLENFREGSLPDKPSNGNSNNSSNNGSSVVSGQIAKVTTDDLNIRSGADTIYPVLSVANTGDSVLIIEKDSSGWYKVQLANGVIGWCNSKYLDSFKSGSITITSTGKVQETPEELINKVISLAKAQIGKPYEYGSTGPNSFDCSGLAQYVFKNGANINLPRNSKAQAEVGRAVSKSDLRPGDLVFFNTSGSGISHLGIYIGDNQMVHAPSSGKKIQIVNITQSYWSSRYVTARRIIY